MQYDHCYNTHIPIPFHTVPGEKRFPLFWQEDSRYIGKQDNFLFSKWTENYLKFFWYCSPICPFSYTFIKIQWTIRVRKQKSVIQQPITLPNWKYLVPRNRLNIPEESQKHTWKHSHTKCLTWASWNTFLFFLCKGSLTCSTLLGIFYLIVKKWHLGDNLFLWIFTLCDQVLKFDWHSSFLTRVGSRLPSVSVERLKYWIITSLCFLEYP